jgi:hypothetical protein
MIALQVVCSEKQPDADFRREPDVRKMLKQYIFSQRDVHSRGP